MILRVLAVGDVCAEVGLDCLHKHLRSLKKLYDVHFTVINGENAAGKRARTGKSRRAGGEQERDWSTRRKKRTMDRRPGRKRTGLSGQSRKAAETEKRK